MLLTVGRLDNPERRVASRRLQLRYLHGMNCSRSGSRVVSLGSRRPPRCEAPREAPGCESLAQYAGTRRSPLHLSRSAQAVATWDTSPGRMPVQIARVKSVSLQVARPVSSG